jgi:hypothetical protein
MKTIFAMLMLLVLALSAAAVFGAPARIKAKPGIEGAIARNGPIDLARATVPATSFVPSDLTFKLTMLNAKTGDYSVVLPGRARFVARE